MNQLYTAAQSRQADARAIAELGIAGFELMRRAGQAAFDVLLNRWPQARSITVVAGKGNNAGDGYVIAALAATLGLRVTLLQVGPAPDRGDAVAAIAFATGRGVVGTRWLPTTPICGDVVVDALLGTGASGALRGDFAAAVAAINDSGAPVLAVDVPSGLNADTGGPCGPCDDDAGVVRATCTVSFITRKLGQYTGLGLEVCGDLHQADLGVPAALGGEGVPLVSDVPAPAPLGANAYKHQRGHVLVCGGDRNMGGAVLLAGEAALRSGAGMVTLVTRAEHRPAVLARRPELMVVDAEDADTVVSLLARADCVVLGPGLDRGAWGRRLFQQVSRHVRAPLILDADGFHHWLADPSPPTPSVITPHIAEAARLLGLRADTVQRDRPAAVRALVARTGAVAVLKGAGSLVADAHRLSVCGAGNPGMATAGMGDVLCGILAAEVTGGGEIYRATVRAVVRHAVAGDRAAAARAPGSLLAADLIDALCLP
ncbi:MAG: NAD(P)H-hydrate dehydratase [Pseudomonadales bacterium]|nr:NAD(P)H-hydrate dehydratase [Pseudomonadales bacterium]